MSWKDIYNKCNSRDLSRITVIKDNIELNSSVKNFNLENGYKLLIITLLIIAVLLIGFWSKPIIILYTMLIYVFSLVLGFIYNIYKIKIDSDGLFFKSFFRKEKIELDNLITIYIEKRRSFFFVIPVYSYNLNIIYVEKEQIKYISLSTLMLKKKSVLNMFDKLEFEEIKIPNKSK